MELDPNNACALNNKGVALIYFWGDIAEKIVEAKKCFEKAKDLFRENAKGIDTEAKNFLILEKKQKEKDVDPNLANVLNNIGILKYREALKNRKENLDSVNTGIEIETSKKNKYAWNYKDSDKKQSELDQREIEEDFKKYFPLSYWLLSPLLI